MFYMLCLFLTGKHKSVVSKFALSMISQYNVSFFTVIIVQYIVISIVTLLRNSKCLL